MKRIVSIVLCVFVVLAWFVTFRKEVQAEVQYRSCVHKAEQSVQDGLYEQAVEYYESALSIKSSKVELYTKIKEANKLYYDEQKTGATKDLYLKSLITCCEYQPYNKVEWDELIKYYMDEGEYTNANKYLRKAERNDLTDDYLSGVRNELKYYYELDTQSFGSYTYLPRYTGEEVGGLYVAHGVETYWLVDESGETKSEDYGFIGMVNGEGKAVYKDPSGFVIKDKRMITRRKLDVDIDSAGQISNGLIPVCKDGIWYYITEDGKKAFGEYEYASSFIQNQAAVKKDGAWTIIDEKGTAVKNGQFEDIKLSEDDHFLHRGKYVIAKRDGKYHIYDDKLKQIGNLSCEDMDIYAGGEMIAVQQGGVWGFADLKGNVVIKPQYQCAKSFSNGYAAVMNEEELWGCIISDGTLVIDYRFYDIGYFNDKNQCLVSEDSILYSFLKFKFQD